MQATDRGHERYAVAIWELEEIGRALLAFWSAGAEGFALHCELVVFVAEEHAGEDVIVEEIDKGYDQLGTIGQ